MAEEVLPGVYQIGMGYVNAFIVAEEGGITLIDSGLPKRKVTILRALRRIGRQPQDLKRIVITHHHVDHTGSLAALVEATSAQVYIHPLDARIVRGEEPMPGPNTATLGGRILGPIVDRLFHPTFAPAKVDREVQDGEQLPFAGGTKAVHTPGHTAGHLSFLMPGHGGVLFVGDAAGNIFGRLGPPFGMFTEDMTQAKESMRKIAALEFDTACFGHGRVLKGKAHAAFRRIVEKMAR